MLGMEDYPETIAEFESKFSFEEACRDYLFRLRWPQGFICPRCQATKAWPTKRNLLVCGACGYQVSMTAGTIFQDTRKPLGMWFRAIWFVTNQKTQAPVRWVCKGCWTWQLSHGMDLAP
jgi:hypothetical protein